MGVTDIAWIQRGRKNGQASQKHTLVLALRKPMTGSELLIAMRGFHPKIQLRDVWLLLQTFEERQLIHCLTPKEVTGRLYFFTDKGCAIVGEGLDVSVASLSPSISWKKYAQVVRGEVRKLTLLEMAMAWKGILGPKTISMIRKQLLQKHPVGLGAAIRAMHELEQLKLIRRMGVTPKRGCTLYGLTKSGQQIVEQIKR